MGYIPIKTGRVANTTTEMGAVLPIGATIYDVDAKKTYKLTANNTATDTITILLTANKLIELGGDTGTGLEKVGGTVYPIHAGGMAAKNLFTVTTPPLSPELVVGAEVLLSGGTDTPEKAIILSVLTSVDTIVFESSALHNTHTIMQRVAMSSSWKLIDNPTTVTKDSNVNLMPTGDPTQESVVEVEGIKYKSYTTVEIAALPDYTLGTFLFDSTLNSLVQCTDATAGANVWSPIRSSTGLEKVGSSTTVIESFAGVMPAGTVFTVDSTLGDITGKLIVGNSVHVSYKDRPTPKLDANIISFTYNGTSTIITLDGTWTGSFSKGDKLTTDVIKIGTGWKLIDNPTTVFKAGNINLMPTGDSTQEDVTEVEGVKYKSYTTVEIAALPDYTLGTFLFDSTLNSLVQCADATAGANVWTPAEKGGIAHSDTTDYVVGDIVTEAGKVYSCKTAHNAKPFDVADWDEVGIKEKGGIAHSATTDYLIGDIVSVLKKTYQCITAHTAKVFDKADWTQIWNREQSQLSPEAPADISAIPTQAEVQAVLDYSKNINAALVTAGVFKYPLVISGRLLTGETGFEFESDAGEKFTVEQGGNVQVLTGNGTTAIGVTGLNDASDVTIKLIGANTYFKFGDDKWLSLNLKLIGDITTLHESFKDLTNMRTFVCDANLSNVTNISSAWFSCTGLTSFPLLDTSSVTNMRGTWHACTGLTSFPLLDTSSVTNMRGTWYSCSRLTSLPLLDTSSVTNVQSAWVSCIKFVSFPHIDTSSLTNVSGAWFKCSKLVCFKELDFRRIQIGPIENTFGLCYALVQPPATGTPVRAGKHATAGTWTNPNPCP